MSTKLRTNVSVEDLIKFAHGQSEWESIDGRIEKYDVEDQLLTVNNVKNGRNVEFTLNENAANQLEDRMHMKQAVSLFGNNSKKWLNDEHMVQQIADLRVKQMADNARLAKTRVIFDPNTHNAKSVMTEKYTGLEVQNYDIIAETLKKFAPNYDAKGSYIDEDHLFLSFSNISSGNITTGSYVNKAAVEEYGIKKGDIIGFGFQISNSMTGNGSLSLYEMAYRMFCDNRMFNRETVDVMRTTHIYTDMFDRLHSDIKTIQSKGPQTIQVLRNAANSPYIMSGVEKFDTWLRKVNIPARHYEGIKKAYTLEPTGTDVDGRINRWGLYNAITRYTTHILPNPTKYLDKTFTKPAVYDPIEAQSLASRGYDLLMV